MGPMSAPFLTEEQRERLVSHLATGVDALLEQTCIEMVALWLEGTRREREMIGSEVHDLGFTPSEHYRALSGGAQSRYRYLATWRHASLCEHALDHVRDPDFREAARIVYFTPYPANKPPYAWSSRASSAPGAESFESATTLKHQAKEGAWRMVTALRRIAYQFGQDPSFYWELRSRFVKAGCRDTVREVLKLEDHPRWGEP